MHTCTVLCRGQRTGLWELWTPEHHTEISEHDGKYLYLMNRVSGPTLIPLLVLSTHTRMTGRAGVTSYYQAGQDQPEVPQNRGQKSLNITSALRFGFEGPWQ